MGIFKKEYWKHVICAILNIKDTKDIYPLMYDINNRFTTGGTILLTNNSNSENVLEKKRISIKPKDVLSELEKIPTTFSLLNIEDKINIIKDKLSLITQRYAKSELDHLLVCLENRKKFNDMDSKGRLFREYFSKFDTTTQNSIDNLLKKYALCMKSADIFIPEFPKEAIDIMKEFSLEVEELCKLKPIFYVIATESSFEKAYEKRDPILLVQSPFGVYYHILGAWDEEMLYLPEL